MFTATLLALGTRLVKFHFSSLVKISVFASFALKIEQLSIKWAQGCLKLKIRVLIRLKHAWKPKFEVWNFTSLVPRARCVEVNIFSKCHGKDEWTLGTLKLLESKDWNALCTFVIGAQVLITYLLQRKGNLEKTWIILIKCQIRQAVFVSTS